MMLWLSSGRKGFDHFEAPDKAALEKGFKEELIKMLQHENKLRMSEEWIAKMEEEVISMQTTSPLAGYSFKHESPVMRALQTEVVKEFGYTSDEDIEAAIMRIRSALATWAPRGAGEEIKNAANYLKFNRVAQTELKVGDAMDMDNVTLFQLSDGDEYDAKGSETSLSDVVSGKDGALTVLLSVSVT